MTTTTYWGYLIRELVSGNGYSVSKGGYHVCYANTLEEARTAIDSVLKTPEHEPASKSVISE